MQIIIKPVGENAYDITIEAKCREAHLMFEPESKTWMLDIFDSSITDSDKAHIGDTITIDGTDSDPDWNEAFKEIIES